MMKFLPLGMYLTALLMGAYVICNRFFDVSRYVPVTDTRTALVLSLGIGVLFTVLCTVLRMGSLRRHIWKY